MWFDKRFEQPAVKELTPVQKVLLRAADLIEERGLAKWKQQDAQGQLCLHGAISMAACGAAYEDGPEYRAACNAVGEHLLATGRGGGKLVFNAGNYFNSAMWNNQPERTQEEVVAALRGAAETP